jgi:MFS family permease
MALITFLVFAGCILLLREKPTQPESSSPERGGDRIEDAFFQMKKPGLTLRSVFIVYFIFGFSYNIYATYFVAYMVDELHVVQGTAGVLWSVFGWTCMISGLIWGFISDRLGRKKALLWNNGIISAAVLIPLFYHQIPVLGLSIFLFGVTFLGTVTIIAASIGDQVNEKQAAVYGLLTLLHGIGQFTGTTFGGFLKDLFGSFQSAFICSLIGFVFCLALTALSTGKSRTI